MRVLTAESACLLMCLSASLARADAVTTWITPPAMEAVRLFSGLKPTRPVPVDALDEAALREKIRAELDMELQKQDVEAQSMLLQRLGFLPHGTDLKESMLKLLTSQVAGFYDPRTGRMAEVLRGGPSWLEKSSVVAHEMTHAAQDHARGLQALQDARREHDDAARALSWALEGQALLLGNRAGYLVGPPIPGPLGLLWGEVESLLIASPVFAAAYRMTVAMEHNDIPPFLVDDAVAAYSKGARFAWTLERVLGRPGHLDILCHPPVSTQEVLHPEQYLEGRRPPPQQVFPAKLLDQDVRTQLTMGEWGLRWLMGDDHAALAEAWRADRAAVLADGSVFWAVQVEQPGPSSLVAERLQKVLPAPVRTEVHQGYVLLIHGPAASTWPPRTNPLLAQPMPKDPPPPAGSACAQRGATSRPRR